MTQKRPEPSREAIWKMFDQISPTYDLVNRVMTLGLDLYWRKKLCSFLPSRKGLHVLDCATGTCDQILSLIKHAPQVGKIVGIDLAKEMIAIGDNKLKRKSYPIPISLQVADALEIPFADETFDCITISFGIRNVTDVACCLREFLRVLKKGGRVLILEGTLPSSKWMKGLDLLYLRYLLPRIGGIISKKGEAYRYLNETIETFPHGEAFLNLMRAAGFSDVEARPLTKGVVTIYQGDKGDAS